MDREKLTEKVKKDIRALLISAPLGVPAHIFPKDYRQMNGKEVPYREMGYRSLDQFILSIPDVVRVGMGPTGFTTFYPVATKETQHIVNMIRKQKKPSIKKAIIPSAIVARKTPVKMSSFSRKGGFGSRGFTPRGGGGNRRPQAKYHPRTQSMPAQPQFPNLPPRMQRQHQQSSTYQPHHSSWQPSSSVSSWNTPPSLQPQQQQRGPVKSRVGTKPDGASLRPRLNSLPEHSNRLHPQHALSSVSAPGKPAPASVVDSTSNLSELWRDEFRTAHRTSVEDLNSWALNNFKQPINLVCVEGMTGRRKEDKFQEKVVVKILLQSLKYRRSKRDGHFEAVQLHFIAPYWDLKCYPQPYDLPEGIKLRAYGNAFTAYSKLKDKQEPSIRVMYYEKLTASGGSSGHSSPRESRSTTPKMEANLSDLEGNIFKLLLKLDRGTYAKRLGKVYQNEYKVTPPDNILELARAMPFVFMEKITDTSEIMHMKEEYRERHNKQGETSSPSTAAPAPAQPSKQTAVDHPPPLPGRSTLDLSSSTVSLAEDRLNDVLVCLVNTPFSFYVQIRDKQQQLFTKMEEDMNKYFSKNHPKTKAVQVRENQLCACLWVEEGVSQWCRALVINQLDTKVNVLFPDYGNQEWVSVSDLCSLPPQFYTLPFQAIQCCLHGVLMKDNMMTNEATDYFAELAADKVCALQVMDSTGARVSVEILDNQLEDDETINSKLISRFHPIASLSPKLPSSGEPMIAVKLTDVDETGVLSIQVVGPGLSKLEELAKQIEERYSTGEAATVESVVGGMYCTEYSEDNCWYRVKVLRETTRTEVLVEYVDYGNEEVVNRSKLRPGLNNELFSLPPQAVKCRLAGVPPPKGMWTDSATDCLVQYIDIQDLNLQVVDYCIKVTNASSVAMALVKLHVKDSAQEMVCVNDILLQDLALFCSLSSDNSESQSSVEIKNRAPSSVSCAVQQTEEPVAGQRSKSESSLPVTLTEVDGVGENGNYTVFNNQAPEEKQHSSKHSSTTASSVHSSLNRHLTASLKDSQTSSSRETEGADDNNCETSSISSLDVSSGIESEISDLVCDKVRGSLKLSETAHPKNNKCSPVEKAERSLVHSPKECIRDGVPYVASPIAVVESGHLAAPSSASRASSSPSSASLSPSQAKSPSPGPLSPPPTSPAPITPPVSPPPIPPTAGVHQAQTKPEGRGTGVVANRWAELPSGKFVEVEVTWAPSPTNFTLLLISNKAELDAMTERLQQLVPSEPHTPPQSLCRGCVCAARFSGDSRWYRAVVTQPFQTHSMQTVVEFLDFGGSEIVPLSALKCLPEKCQGMPYQAVKASLYGIRGDVSNPEIVKRFEEMVYTKRLFALRKAFDFSSSRVSIVLLDTTDSSGRDKVINEVLLQL